MSRSQRDKGARVEREIVHLHKDMGVEAERVPLSGAAGGSYTGDVVIRSHTANKEDAGGGYWQMVVNDIELRGEVKARKNGEGFKVLEGWLGDNDILFLKRNQKEPMVVLPWATYQKLIS